MGNKNAKKGRVEGFAERLEDARKGAKLTSCQQLADKMGVDMQRINSWERGTSEPPLTRLVELCKALHVSADYLLGIPPQGSGGVSIGSGNIGGDNQTINASAAPCKDCPLAVANANLAAANASLAAAISRKP